MKFFALIFGVLCLVKTIKCDNYVLEIQTTNLTQLSIPALANGNLGMLVYGDSILINGIYNGAYGESHRARVPNYANIQFEHCGANANSMTACTYSLDMKQAVFRATAPYNVNTFALEQEIYVHRYYTHTIVNRIRVTRPVPSTTAGYFTLSQHEGVPSEDITFDAPEAITINAKPMILLTGRTKQVEDPMYQTALRNVFVLYETVVPSIEINSTTLEYEYVHLTIVGQSREEVLEEYNIVGIIPYSIISERHNIQWENFWTNSGIEVVGNDELAQVVYASQFALASSLPSKDTFLPKNPFYGLSPSGLPMGGIVLKDYQGHSFWDTEMWMQPPTLLMDPSWSKDLLNYRFLVHKAALNNAADTGYKGLRFPWESAFTGREVTPECCPEVVDYQHHIIADIAFAVRSHLFVTHDLDWFKEEGCLLAYETARFWESRVSYDSSSGLYDINGVMGPDEDTHNVSNNAYTNVNAGYNLYFGEFASCVCNQWFPTLYPKTTDFSKIARNIKLVHDEINNFTPQFEGYQFGQIIKQADTILISYPLQYPLDDAVRKNNLEIYENVTREDGPAMTWAMYVINNMDIGIYNEDLFKRSYVPYVRKPFNVWNETIVTTPGAGNFITGAGGFLQMMINGFGGLRLHTDYIEFTVPISMPPTTTQITYNGLHYLGAEFQVIRRADVLIFTFKKLGTLGINLIYSDTPERSETVGLNIAYTIHRNVSLVMKPASYEFGQCSLPGYRIGGGGSALRPLLGAIVALASIRLLKCLF